MGSRRAVYGIENVRRELRVPGCKEGKTGSMCVYAKSTESLLVNTGNPITVVFGLNPRRKSWLTYPLHRHAHTHLTRTTTHQSLTLKIRASCLTRQTQNVETIVSQVAFWPSGQTSPQ